MMKPVRLSRLLAGTLGGLIVLFGSVTTVSLVASTSTDRSVTDFGAIPDDGTDDTAALQSALDGLRSGDTLNFAPGKYLHSGVLTVRVPGVKLIGSAAKLVAIDETRSAVRLDADNVTVTGLTFGVATTTRRFEAPEQQKLWISGHSGAVLSDITITGSAAAGIFVDGASRFRIERANVRDTRADGIHITGGSHDGLIERPTVSRTGDDGVAVVSYQRDVVPCSSIRINAPQVFGTTWGRGLSVVGGKNITYTDVLVEESNAAAVYIAVEGDPYFTRAVEDVAITGGRLRRSNYNAAIDHGAILIYAGRSAVPLRGVTIQNLSVEDTRTDASHDVGVIAVDAVSPQGLRFNRVRFSGGPAVRYGGNARTDSYRVED